MSVGKSVFAWVGVALLLGMTAYCGFRSQRDTWMLILVSLAVLAYEVRIPQATERPSGVALRQLSAPASSTSASSAPSGGSLSHTSSPRTSTGNVRT